MITVISPQRQIVVFGMLNFESRKFLKVMKNVRLAVSCVIDMWQCMKYCKWCTTTRWRFCFCCSCTV